MKSLLLALTMLLATNAARAAETCSLPVCKIVEDPNVRWQHVLQINGITVRNEDVMGVQDLVNDMATFERHGVCKGIYPEGY